jgi:hypothetical protein
MIHCRFKLVLYDAFRLYTDCNSFRLQPELYLWYLWNRLNTCVATLKIATCYEYDLNSASRCTVDM